MASAPSTRGHSYPADGAASAAVTAMNTVMLHEQGWMKRAGRGGAARGLSIPPDHDLSPRALRMMTGRSGGGRKTELLLREVGRSRPRRLTNSTR